MELPFDIAEKIFNITDPLYDDSDGLCTIDYVIEAYDSFYKYICINLLGWSEEYYNKWVHTDDYISARVTYHKGTGQIAMWFTDADGYELGDTNVDGDGYISIAYKILKDMEEYDYDESK